MNVRVLKNITFKQVNGKSLNLDIYFPQNTSDVKFPAVVFVHGGGWLDGNKSMIIRFYRHYILDALIKNGYVVISIDYSLINTDTVHFPVPAEDCKDAVRWVRKNADVYNIDTENIGLWGASSGAHLSLLAAYSSDNDFIGSNELRFYSAAVNYVVDNFGPVDINKIVKPELNCLLLQAVKIWSKKTYEQRQFLLTAMSGLNIKQQKDKVAEICRKNSPINYVSQNSVPTLILHGDEDKIVPIRQSQKFSRLLTQNGVDNQFIAMSGLGHDFQNCTDSDIEAITEYTMSFIKRYTNFYK